MTQKDAVFNAISTVFQHNNISFQAGATNAASLLSRNLRAEVTNILLAYFSSGTVELSADAQSKLSNEAALRSYVSSLITNWLRKDSRLNGGSNLPKQAKSKVVVSDPQLKALQQLLSAQTDQSKRLEIQGHIDQRLSQLSQ